MIPGITFERWNGVDCVRCGAFPTFGPSIRLSEGSAETPQAAAAAAAGRLAAFHAATAGRFGPLLFGSPGCPGDCRKRRLVVERLWRPCWEVERVAQKRGWCGRPTGQLCVSRQRMAVFAAILLLWDGAPAGRRENHQKCDPRHYLSFDLSGVAGRGREGHHFCV